MICLKIEEENVKKFMEVLLQSKAFDSLWVHTIEIDSFMHFTMTRTLLPREIEGIEEMEGKEEIPLENIPKQEYYHEYWRKLRPFVLSIIMQGKPRNLEIVFSLPETQRKMIDEDIKGFFCNIKYNEKVQIRTNVSRDRLDLSKEAEHKFDDLIVELLNKHKVPFISEL